MRRRSQHRRQKEKQQDAAAAAATQDQETTAAAAAAATTEHSRDEGFWMSAEEPVLISIVDIAVRERLYRAMLGARVRGGCHGPVSQAGITSLCPGPASRAYVTGPPQPPVPNRLSIAFQLTFF